MGKKPSDEKAVVLSTAQLKKITEAASIAAIEQYRKEIERTKQENRDKRLYNTRLLMEGYKGMVEYCKDAVYDATQVDEDYELRSLIELMSEGNDSFTLTVHSIQERVGEVRVILHHVDKMLKVYRQDCEASEKPEVMRKWETINYLYLEEESLTVRELAEKFFVDERTVYRYCRAGLQDLGALFFGDVFGTMR